MREKTYNRSNSHFYDLIQSNHKVFSTENAYWERHAGYRKNKSSKTILHDSLLCLKETLSELYDGVFHISSIVKLNCSADFGYFVYFPENDLMIKIYADASYDSIGINWQPISEYMNEYYAKEILTKINNPKWPASEDAKIFTTDFYNSIMVK